jgi:hypothetical protein
VSLALAAKPNGAPPSDPTEAAWFQQAYIPGIGGCCSEADGFREGITYPEEKVNHPHPGGIILKEWHETPDKPGDFDIKVVDQWLHVDKKSVLPPRPPNPTGGAVAFLVFNYGWAYDDLKPQSPWVGQSMHRTENYTIFLRCFSPGNEF